MCVHFSLKPLWREKTRRTERVRWGEEDKGKNRGSGEKEAYRDIKREREREREGGRVG